MDEAFVPFGRKRVFEGHYGCLISEKQFEVYGLGAGDRERDVRMRKIGRFIVDNNELNRVNEGLRERGLDADAVVSITASASDDFVTVWFREKA